jgi:hypothetical protein
MNFQESFNRAQKAYDNMSDEDRLFMLAPSSKCFPKSDKCPYWNQFQELSDKHFCEGCQHLKRDTEYDSGNKRSGYLMAYICSKNAMNPEIYEIEPEPDMPWE